MHNGNRQDGKRLDRNATDEELSTVVAGRTCRGDSDSFWKAIGFTEMGVGKIGNVAIPT